MSKKKRVRKPAYRPVNVNLGCGTHLIPDWVNIDNSIGFDSPYFLAGDAREIPLLSDTVDYLLCDNVLEHIPMSDIPVVLFEIRRVLKKGGRAIIIVPDFKNAVESWLKANADEQRTVRGMRVNRVAAEQMVADQTGIAQENFKTSLDRSKTLADAVIAG